MRPGVFPRLLEIAVEQHGFVTPADAVAAGIDAVRLRQLAQRGMLEHRGHGLYRVPQLPLTELAEYQEAVLWARGRGVISHESALAVHELADVNPRRIHLTVPPSCAPRRAGAGRYRVARRTLQPAEVTAREGIPVVVAARAIQDAHRDGLDPALLRQAIEAATGRGLLLTEETKTLNRMLTGGQVIGLVSEEDHLRQAAAKEREAACARITGRKPAVPDALRRLATSVITLGVETADLTMAHHWLREAGVGPDVPDPCSYAVALQRSGDTDAMIRLAFAMALAADERHTRRPGTWDARAVAHVRRLMADAQHAPTHWEQRRLVAAEVIPLESPQEDGVADRK